MTSPDPLAPPPPSDEHDELLARALHQEGLYACPSFLLAGIVAEHAVEALGTGRRALGLAAAVLLAVGALAALTGRLPSTDTPLLPALASTPVEVPTQELFAQAPRLEGVPASLLASLAGALLAGGVLLARRWGIGAPSRATEGL